MHRVTSNLKEYAVKALVNTVDHLGSISFKVSSLVDQSFKEVSDTSLRLSCIHEVLISQPLVCTWNQHYLHIL
jgi:hypothetical protein